MADRSSEDSPVGVTAAALEAEAQALCKSCGACCAFSKEWPRFSTEDDADLALIPPHLVDAGQGGMRCRGDRCAALCGEVGVATSCGIYPVRPEVCRSCLPGDHSCRLARERFGLPPIAPLPLNPS